MRKIFALLLSLSLILSLCGCAEEVETGSIKSMAFSKSSDISLKIGETVHNSKNYLSVELNRGKTLSPEDVIFISDNPEIATICLIDTSGSKVNYEITAINEGKTYVYASSKDGLIISEKIKVTVEKPVEAEKIEISLDKPELVIGESISSSVTILPKNAEDKNVFWASSDESVATISEKGIITAVGGGIAIITATMKNGVSSTAEVTVDGTKHLMNVRASHSREDKNNIGDEWSFQIQLNGEKPPSTIILTQNNTLSFWARFTESDKNPDIGEASSTYTVSEDDLVNGFTINMDLFVKENGGKNSGKEAHFIVTFSFSPII